MPHLAASVMVTFAARHGDPYPRTASGEYIRESHDECTTWGPTLRAVGQRESPLFGNVTDLYYLCHASVQGGVRKVATSDGEVALETEKAIARHVEPRNRPKFHIEQLCTKGPPNDHGELFELVKNVLRRVRAIHPNVEIVLQLSSGTSAMHAVLLLAGSVGIVEGPIRLVQAERSENGGNRPGRPIADVNLSVATILQLARTSLPLTKGGDEALSFSFDRAKSAALRRALSDAQRAATLPFPILLRGERGVGKSTIAQVIRAASPFRKPSLDKSWPSVACGQFTDADRLNAELCGTSKGAFTGAENKWGLLKIADGDTLFLDEIQDLDARSQRVLIRVIEDGTYYRLGEDCPRRSKFRLICGTNQSDVSLLSKLSADFYDRIRDIEIEIPPLRDCREDLPWMWEETWRRVALECGIRPEQSESELHVAVLDALTRLPLPGNWRDLRRLAVRLAASLIAGDARDRNPTRVLEAFAKEQRGGAGFIGNTEPNLLTKRDVSQYERLEQSLGRELERFWSMCASLPPGHVLGELLGDRHRAKRAIDFIRRTHPVRLGGLIRTSGARK